MARRQKGMDFEDLVTWTIGVLLVIGYLFYQLIYMIAEAMEGLV